MNGLAKVKDIKDIEMDLNTLARTELAIEKDETPESWTAKVRRFDKKITSSRVKTWHSLKLEQVGHVDPKLDHGGGDRPFFASFDKEWPLCEGCKKPMSFFLQTTDPSDRGDMGTIQIFSCEHHWGQLIDETGEKHRRMIPTKGHDRMEHQYQVRNIFPTIDEYHHIPAPRSTYILKEFSVELQETYERSLSIDEGMGSKPLQLKLKIMTDRYGEQRLIEAENIILSWETDDCYDYMNDASIMWHPALICRHRPTLLLMDHCDTEIYFEKDEIRVN